jgi:hypothetical protein
MQTGVSFTEMTAHLKDTLGYEFESKYLEYFRVWFHQSFYNTDISIAFKHGTESGILNVTRQLNHQDSMLMIMTADSYEILLDYEKLQQTRESSKKAHRLGITAIWISVLLGLIQIVIGYMQFQGQDGSENEKTGLHKECAYNH